MSGDIWALFLVMLNALKGPGPEIVPEGVLSPGDRQARVKRYGLAQALAR